MTGIRRSDFPRVNLISIFAGTLCLISVFFPWWAISGSGNLASWNLWSFPQANIAPSSTSQISQLNYVLSWASVFLLALVLITSILLLIGSYAEGNRFLVASFALAISSVFSYTGLVIYAVSSSCPTISSSSTNTCINGPFGAQYGNSDWTTWGFESGFYLFLVGGFLTLGAVVLHRIFFTELGESPKETRETSHPATIGAYAAASAANCSACGKPLVDQAKFCPNCGNPVAKVQTVSS